MELLVSNFVSCVVVNYIGGYCGWCVGGVVYVVGEMCVISYSGSVVFCFWLSVVIWDDFVGQCGSVVSRQYQLDVLSIGSFGVCQVVLLFVGCVSQQVIVGLVYVQFVYVILFSVISSLVVRDVNGERFWFQVSICCCCFNFSQGYWRQVNVCIVVLVVNGNSIGYIGNFIEEINLVVVNSGISCMGSSYVKKCGCYCCREKNFFYCYFFVRVNYELMSIL